MLHGVRKAWEARARSTFGWSHKRAQAAFWTLARARGVKAGGWRTHEEIAAAYDALLPEVEFFEIPPADAT